jgi:hypothetical protein
MAALLRSAKSGSGWTANDLLTYNITVSSQSPETFYNRPLQTVASASGLDPNILSGTQRLSDETCPLLVLGSGVEGTFRPGVICPRLRDHTCGWI